MRDDIQVPLFTDQRPLAIFSPDRVYRYMLHRKVDKSKRGICLFIMLNPSTADENQDDPTIRRCKRFAKDWDYEEVQVANIFAYRATDPNDLKNPIDPVGPHNDHWIEVSANRAISSHGIVVCAWGNHGAFQSRGLAVRMLLRKAGVDIHHIGLNQTGEPKHPLYVAANTTPTRYGTDA